MLHGIDPVFSAAGLVVGFAGVGGGARNVLQSN
jgi:hypothetical protein